MREPHVYQLEKGKMCIVPTLMIISYFFFLFTSSSSGSLNNLVVMSFNYHFTGDISKRFTVDRLREKVIYTIVLQNPEFILKFVSPYNLSLRHGKLSFIVAQIGKLSHKQIYLLLNTNL